MSEPLKPCPFCGGKARIYRLPYVSGTGRLIQKYSVECTECRAELPIRLASEQEAETITNWNNRHELSAQWLLHDETCVWECSACHSCFELESGVPADKFITYCPICGSRLHMPQ